MRFWYLSTCLKRSLKKKTRIGFRDRLSLNAGQKYCRMLQGEHSAILSTFIKLPFIINFFVLSIFEWPLKTGFTVCTGIFLSLWTCDQAQMNLGKLMHKSAKLGENVNWIYILIKKILKIWNKMYRCIATFWLGSTLLTLVEAGTKMACQIQNFPVWLRVTTSNWKIYPHCF